MIFRRKWLLVFAVLTIVFTAIWGGIASAEQEQAKAKYVFLFIGDGMAAAQRYAAELYLAKEKGLTRPEDAKLVMNTFPAHGMATTYDLTSVIPDSASAGTAIACGRKTKSRVLGMDAEGKVAYENIAEKAKKKDWKIGILSTVSLDNATPAAFYAHVPHRNRMYDISLQLANSGFDYFAGGQLFEPADKKDPSKPNALETAKNNGYTIAMGRPGYEGLKPGAGKVIAMNSVVDDQAAMYFTIDRNKSKDHVTIAEYLEKCIELLDNPTGFFIMVEGGKIDWACHVNDAASAIHDVLALDEAVAVAVRFYEKHPKETLIIVTGDHETGGMAIGFTGTKYSSFVDKLRHQNMSYIEFSKKIEAYKKDRTAADAKLEDLMPLIKDAFGLFVMPAGGKAASPDKTSDASKETKKAAEKADQELDHGMALSDLELKVLREAFKLSMLSKDARPKDEHTFLLYGKHDPLTVKLTTIMSNKAGIGWTSFAHTGLPVQTSALGVGAEMFNGYYDQTDIFKKMINITGLGR